MRPKAVKILSTKKLEQISLEDLDSITEVVDFDVLELNPVAPDKLDFYKNIIFTSFKGTLRGLEILGERAQNYHYFCVGKKSEEYLKELGLEIYGFAYYSKDLAELLVENLKDSNFSYLCSKDRLNTLPDILSENNVVFEEVVTYQTDERADIPKGEFDIYLWFSPKGVKCLQDKVDRNAMHICIGETTAAAAKEFFNDDNVVCPELPKMEDLIKLARVKAIEINRRKCAETIKKS